MNLTAEQETILAAARTTKDNLMIEALAGCAKTTILVAMSKVLPGPALALAFNVKIKKELEEKFPQSYVVLTLNGLGHRAWGRAIGRQPEVDDRKLGKLVTSLAKEGGYDLNTDQWTAVREAVSAAMHAGLVPNKYPNRGLVPDTQDTWLDLIEDTGEDVPWELCREVLIESVKRSFGGVISFDDQVYMPAMYSGVFPRFPLVMVDEAQDLSPMNHIMLQRASAGRLIIVGDPKQAIYAFRGADTESMSKILKLRKDWTILPLSTTFRCPKVVVSRQWSHAPNFTAFETNPEGHFFSFDEDWTWSDVTEALALTGKPNPKPAILCRNNAPLLSIAFKLIRQGIGCVMLGRDIGKTLIAASRKIIPNDDTPKEQCFSMIDAWEAREVALAEANGKLDKGEKARDKAQCLLAVLESGECKDARALRAQIKAIFSREHGLVTLSTGHRAKGLEYDLVIHLDPWRLPSRQSQKALSLGNDKPMQQEKNLLYVIETRAKHTLINANLEDFE